jgi:hypothetical protein
LTPAPTEEPTALDKNPGDLRMAVISDIHATTKGDPLTNVAKSTAKDPTKNALTAIRELLPVVAPEVNLIVCPGDLVNGGKTEPMKWVWKQLHELSTAVGASLIATVGNHDLLLKPEGADKADKELRRLKPKFPHPQDGCAETYWAYDYAIIAEANWRVVTINSSCQLGSYDQSESKHGRLSRECMLELPEKLDQIGADAEFNICLAHHHPQEWTEDSDGRTSHMSEGDRLIDLLQGREERWMYVHGHMHHPRLDYLGYGSGGTTRLASGSIGASLLGESGVSVRNQMHIVDFANDVTILGLGMAGSVTSYDWEPGYGWQPALENSGLPHKTSFGYRRDGFELAAWLQEKAKNRGQRGWQWAEIVALEPRLEYLADVDRLDFYRGVRRLGGGVSEKIREVTFSW